MPMISHRFSCSVKYPLFHTGFEAVMKERGPGLGICEVSLLTLQTSAAVGAAALGAQAAECPLPMDYSTYAQTFYTAKFS